jgi:porphobilinogen synthase
MRRLRGRKVQPLLREGRLHTTDLVAPIFLDETIGSPKPIDAMPGQSRYPVASAGEAAGRLWDAGIQAVLLFGIPEKKDAGATGAYAPDGVVQQAVRNIRETVPEMVVITDVCACEYTDHGHCGIVGDTRYGMDLLNDPSLELMSRIALSHAESGADIVAPSCMLDGMVRSIRSALDTEGHADIMIMSYSTKFASAFYSPFREAAGSGYQEHLPDRSRKRARSVPRIVNRRRGGGGYPDGEAGGILP